MIDSGALYTRVDFAGNDVPSVTVRTASETPVNGVSVETDPGRSAGAIPDWERLAGFWDSVLTESLGTRAENQPLLVVDWAESTKFSRELLAQVAFETLGVPALYLAAPAVLALYAVNRTTGLSIDVGHTSLRIAPVYEGFQFGYATTTLPIGGIDIEARLRTLVLETHIGDATTTRALDTLDWRVLKEAVSEVRPKQGVDGETSTFTAKQYAVVEGRSILVTPDQYLGCTEMLFTPATSPDGKNRSTFTERVHLALMQCEPDIRRELAANIMLYGGGAALKGLAERLRSELVDVLPSSMHPNVAVAHDPSTVAWRGGSILASITMFQQLWVTKQDYNEHGPLCILRKDTMR